MEGSEKKQKEMNCVQEAKKNIVKLVPEKDEHFAKHRQNMSCRTPFCHYFFGFGSVVSAVSAYTCMRACEQYFGPDSLPKTSYRLFLLVTVHTPQWPD